MGVTLHDSTHTHSHGGGGSHSHSNDTDAGRRGSHGHLHSESGHGHAKPQKNSSVSQHPSSRQAPPHEAGHSHDNGMSHDGPHGHGHSHGGPTVRENSAENRLQDQVVTIHSHEHDQSQGEPHAHDHDHHRSHDHKGEDGHVFAANKPSTEFDVPTDATTVIVDADLNERGGEMLPVIPDYGSIDDRVSLDQGRPECGSVSLYDDDSSVASDAHIEGKKQTNINVRAAFIHVIGDMVQSIGVLVSAYIIYYKVSTEVYFRLDTFGFRYL